MSVPSTTADLADLVARSVPRRRPGVGSPLHLRWGDRPVLALGRGGPMPLGPAVGLAVVAAAVTVALDAWTLGRSTTVGECLPRHAIPAGIDPTWTVAEVLAHAAHGTPAAGEDDLTTADAVAVALGGMLAAATASDLTDAVATHLDLPSVRLARSPAGLLRWQVTAGDLAVLGGRPVWRDLADGGVTDSLGRGNARRVGVADSAGGAGVWAWPDRDVVLAGRGLAAPVAALDLGALGRRPARPLPSA